MKVRDGETVRERERERECEERCIATVGGRRNGDRDWYARITL